MKKVLFVFNHPAPYKVRLLNELAKVFDLTVIFERDSNSDREKAFYSETKCNFKQVFLKGIKVGRENFISSGVKNHIKHNKYDLIVMNGYSNFSEMSAIRYLKKKSIPYVLYINGGIIKQKETALKRKLKTYFIKGAKAYFSPDEESNKYLVYYGANPKLIYNYPYSTIYKSEIAIKPTKKDSKNKIFVSSGQLIKRKNYFELIKKWKGLPANYYLYIFGDGPLRARLNKYIDKNKLQNVCLKGYVERDKMLSFFKTANAFIFPSNEDIYGHVINEALSQGLPVISTKNVNSAKKLIKNKVNGILIDSLEELDSAIDIVLSNDLFNASIETASKNTLELMISNHIKIFNEVIGK